MPTPLPRPRRRSRNFWLGSGITALAIAIAWFVTALALFVFPRQQPLREADAIVALSPPRERLPVALEAFENGVAPWLWVSYVPRDLESSADRTLADETCASDAEEVECFSPFSEDTIGEARAVAELVERTGAKSVIVTTHTSHSARTRFLFENCLPEGTELQLLLVDDPDSPTHAFGRMLYETGAFAKAVAQTHLCDR